MKKLGVAIEMPGWRGAGVEGWIAQMAGAGDANGLLQFAGQPRDAPIIHFARQTQERELPCDFNRAVTSQLG